MQLNLYKINDGDNVINKLMENELPLNVVLKTGLDIINPVIRLTAIDGREYTEFNYLEIPYLKRFYFIDSVENINSKIFELRCTCDVIETYKQQILNGYARYKRPMQHGDYIQTDVDYSVIKSVSLFQADKQTFTNDKSIILTTVGA